MKITIDTEKWMTQQDYANKINESITVVHSWVRRNKIIYKTYPELGDLTLVKVGSETSRKKKAVSKALVE